MPYKTPESVLVVIHTPEHQVLLLERADHPDWWQSVTGSLEAGELPLQTAFREISEETGIDARQHHLVDWGYRNQYEIYACFRHRYAPDVTHNTEHVFGLRINEPISITLSQEEHLQYRWVPAMEAAEQCFSPSNREAINFLLQREHHD